MREDRSAVSLDVLVELDARVGDLSEEVLEPTPALLQGLNPQVDPAQLQQVEGIEEHPDVVSLTVELLEVRRAVGVTEDRRAVEDKGGRPKSRHSLSNEGIPVRPVVALAGEQANATVILLPNDQSVAIVLDLVNPVRSDRRLVGSGRDARFAQESGADEARRILQAFGAAQADLLTPWREP